MSKLDSDPSVAVPSAHAVVWRAVRPWLACALAAIAVWLAVRRVQWGSVASTIGQSNPLLLGLALVSVLGTTALKAVRWRALLGPRAATLSGMRILRVLFVGQAGNILLPARLGDAARAVLIGAEVDGGTAAALGTIAGEKVLDGVMGLGVLVALAVFTPLPSWLQRPALALALTTICLLLLLAIVTSSDTRISGLFRHRALRLSGAWTDRLVRALSGFRVGLEPLQQPIIAFKALVLSASVWFVAGLTNLVTMAALRIEAPFWSVPLVLVACYVANFLPAVPAQVGIFEYACILALAAAGVGQEQALVFALILHVLVHSPPLLIGPLALVREGLSWNQLLRKQDEYAESQHVAAE